MNEHCTQCWGLRHTLAYAFPICEMLRKQWLESQELDENFGLALTICGHSVSEWCVLSVEHLLSVRHQLSLEHLLSRVIQYQWSTLYLCGIHRLWGICKGMSSGHPLRVSWVNGLRDISLLKSWIDMKDYCMSVLFHQSSYLPCVTQLLFLSFICHLF
jgi:hypothetical protein